MLGICGAANAQQLTAARPGDTVAISVPIPVGARTGGEFQYAADSVGAVRLVGMRSGTMQWVRTEPAVVQVPLRLVIPAAQQSGTLLAARVRVDWLDGSRDSADVRVVVRPAEIAAGPVIVNTATGRGGQEWTSTQVGGLTKEVEVELYGSTRATSPGGLVVVRYSINSYEDQDERVRLRLEIPAGWTLLDKDIEAQEWLLESWESLEGEIRVTVPQNARAGERHMVRVMGEVLGEPGGAAVFSYVQVVKRGGLKAGDVGLTGTTSIHASNLAPAGLETARYGGVVDLSGRLARRTTLSLNYRQGPREGNLTNYRIAQEETRWSGTLRNPGWMLQFGNQVTSSGNVLTGPYVRGQGMSLRRTQGLLVGDLTVAQPTSFVGDAGGHLLRGSAGLAGKHGRLAATFSDFGRPVGGYSTVPRYPQDIDPDSLERLERERLAAAKAPSNRVQGAGVDAELQLAKVHRFNVRGGWLHLSNAAGASVEDPSAEVQYGFNHRRATFNARWRQMPHSLQGIQLPGDETSVDASLKVIGEWRLAGRAYRTLNETLGNAHRSQGDGASFGVRYFREGWRMDVRGNYREWNYGQQPTVARTINLSLGVPLGPLSLSGYADVGEQHNATVRQPTESYRGDLRWSGKAGTASWSASYYESLNAPPRLRTDVLGSLKLREWEWAGGAWATRGWKAGGEPGFWSQIGVPVSYDLLLSLGIEHAPPAYGQAPTWLGTVGVRKKVAFALPFLRDGSVPAAAPIAQNPSGEVPR